MNEFQSDFGSWHLTIWDIY